ncbi:MAG TPA: DUF2752 domain-containing protein [Pirellulaceae bacterium]|nr:DUF2752 domain-containing protein [Pirellulaceae bacterium]
MNWRRSLLVAESELVHPSHWIARWALVASGLAICLALATARCLTPDERGYGTHQQLGLPPCSGRYLWRGVCPSCGMTTSWSWMMRGNLVRAAEANISGLAMGIAATLAMLWLLISGFRGRWWIGFPHPWLFATITGSVAILALLSWLQKMFF